MPRIFKTAERLDALLRCVPKLRRKVDEICVQYHQIHENFNYDLATNGERWLLQTLAARNRLGTVFDVGANHGDWAELVLAANPGATIHGFEISPPTFQKVSARLAGQKKVFVNSFGLSAEPGELEIKYNPDEDGLTTMFDTVGTGEGFKILKARVERGQSYCTEKAIKKIDFLKIDVEGAEHLVLQGFGDLLNPSAIPVVQFEYGMVNILTKFLLKDFHKLFESRGYRLGKLYPAFVGFRKYRFEYEDFRGPNYVAASPEVAALLEKRNRG
jgi:FkbM family methyltransferase